MMIGLWGEIKQGIRRMRWRAEVLKECWGGLTENVSKSLKS